MLKKGFLRRIPVQSVFVITWLLLCVQPGFSEEALVLQPDADGVQRTTIKMESYIYAPKELIVELGKPVELTLQNDSFLVPHNFLLDSPNGQRVAEADVSGGDTDTVQFTLTTPGTYPFYCNNQLLFFPTHRGRRDGGTHRRPLIRAIMLERVSDQFLLRTILKRVSRSFYLTLAVLPKSVRNQVGLAYLFARAADTIADTGQLDQTTRIECLRRLKAQFVSESVNEQAIKEIQFLVAPRQQNPSEAVAA